MLSDVFAGAWVREMRHEFLIKITGQENVLCIKIIRHKTTGIVRKK